MDIYKVYGQVEWVFTSFKVKVSFKVTVNGYLQILRLR